MIDFLGTYGPWLLSLAALAQFWIWILLRSRRARGRLRLYESGTVEIGYESNGPTIALSGVIRSLDRGIFIKSMELALVADKDKSRSDFRWMAFKPNFFLPLSGHRSWEMPGPFLVSTGDPRRFNVVFNDVKVFQEVKSLLHGYYQQWHETEKRILETDRFQEELVAEFKRRDICVSAYTELDRKCYWEQGGYSLALKVLTEDGMGDFTRHFRFNLSKIDEKLLRANCIAMLEEPICTALGKPQAPYRLVQADYLKGPGDRP